jgi:hypothetical protein
MAIKIPFPTIPTILTISTLLLCLGLIATSILTIIWTDKAIDHDFSTHEYRWYRGPEWDMDSRPIVTIAFDYVNENLVFASAGMAISGGIAGIVGWFFTRVSSFLQPRINMLIY